MRTTFTRRTLPLVLTMAAIFVASGPLAAQQLKSPIRQLPADALQQPATQQTATPPTATPAAQQPATPQTASQQPAANGPVLQLSIDQAVDMSLETSLGLKAERVNVDITAQGIAAAQSAFIPTQAAVGLEQAFSRIIAGGSCPHDPQHESCRKLTGQIASRRCYGS